MVEEKRKISFDIVAIAKNEANVLPRLFESLKEFRERGGRFYLLDTGSTDKTVQVAKDFGCEVIEVKDKFVKTIDKFTANAINRKLVVKGDADIVKEGDTLFDYAAARNHISSFADCDMICTLDCDEAYSRFDIDKINSLIEQGVEQLEYRFVYAHKPDGSPAIQFTQSKFFDRRKVSWSGVVHEVLGSKTKDIPKVQYVDESIILLEHYQEFGKSHRSNYLVGLALDCYLNPEKDRQSHYFARELMYSGRYLSALKEFERHVSMNAWPAERAQSLVYMGDCFGKLNLPEQQFECYSRAFYVDSKRRAALIALAQFMKHNNNHIACAAYAKAALMVPFSDYYANEASHYEHLPHELLYWSLGWMGDISGAQKHILKALDYQPFNGDYLRDTNFYFEYGDTGIPGWMSFKEIQFLYNTAKNEEYKTIVEIGSWKGRSTHALCSGAKKHNAIVYAVDTFLGSEDERDDTNWMAKKENIFEIFSANTKSFDNLKVIRKTSVEAAKEFEDKSIDVVFIDAGHTYKDVQEDIEAWLPKCKKLICGHDYVKSWMGVIDCVNDKFTKPDSVCDSIWSVDLTKRESSIKIAEPQKIPKIIYTIWLGKEPPEFVKKCIETHKIEGYEHRMITNDNYPTHIEYVNEAISCKNWVKACDYLRMYLLNETGGIYLDADMEILHERTFDKLLKYDAFAAREENNFVANSLVGAVASHPLFEEYFKKVHEKFTGSDDKNFESSMELFTPLAYEYAQKNQFKVLEPEYFFPYNHQTGKINVTRNSIAFHHFMKSWINTTDLLPTVSILIPQLGREEGLKRCLRSIDKLYYPKHLIETIIIKGEESVPEKVKKGLAQSKGSVICYAANDIEFECESLYRAVLLNKDFALVTFNTGDLLPDNGNIAEHFIIRRDFIKNLEKQEIFDTDFHHVGVDNFLWAQCERMINTTRADDAIVKHHHFSKTILSEFDDTYRRGWSQVEKDRETLKKKLALLNREIAK